MQERSDADLAAAYLKHLRTGASEDLWAFDDVLAACSDLERGVALALLLIDIARDEVELSYVAAGPVEDLLKWHGLKALAAFERAAEHSEKVRRALAGVRLGKDQEAQLAWLALLKRYGLSK